MYVRPHQARHMARVEYDLMREMVTRVVIVVAGLILFGAGIGLLFLADLGVGPWDVLHDALAGLLDRRPGTVILGLGGPLVALLIGLRQPIGLATVANVAIVGTTVNGLLAVVDTPSAMAVRLVLMATAPMVVAFGSMLYIGGGLGIGPRDGLMTALVDAGLSFRVARTLLEVTVLLVGSVLGGRFGLGTVAFALTVGPALQFFRARVWAGYPEAPRYVYRRAGFAD